MTSSQDGSLRLRLYKFREFYDAADQLAVGTGLAGAMNSNNGVDAILDGTVMHALVGMGVFIGPIFLISIVWAAIRAIACVTEVADAEHVVIAAFMAGELWQIFLSSVTEAELGFLFWTFAGIGTALHAGKTGPLAEAGRPHDRATSISRRRSTIGVGASALSRSRRIGWSSSGEC